MWLFSNELPQITFPKLQLAAVAAAAVIALGGLSGPAKAADKPELTVYTYDAFAADWGPGPAIKANFEAVCDCVVNFVAVDSSVGILSRIQLEGDSSKADVVLGLDTNLMKEAKETGLLAAHALSPESLSAMEGALPMAWDDDTFVPFDFGYFAFIYDTQTLSEPPKSLKELVDAPADLKILLQDPRTSTPGLGLLLWVRSVYGDEAPEAWKKLAEKTVTTTKGWSEAYGLFLEGEAPMVLSYTTSPAYHMIVDGEDRYQAAEFAEGHYMQVEVAARLKNAPHPELAEEFLAFILTPGFQSTIPTGNWMYPVIPMAGEMPAEFGGLVSPDKPLHFAPEEVQANRKAWVDEWLGAVTE